MLKRAFLSGLMLLGTVLPLAAQNCRDTSWVPTNRFSAGVCIAPQFKSIVIRYVLAGINQIFRGCSQNLAGQVFS